MSSLLGAGAWPVSQLTRVCLSLPVLEQRASAEPRCCRPALGMSHLLLISPRQSGHSLLASASGPGSRCVPALAWLMHGKGKLPKAGDSDGSERCSPVLPAQVEGEAAGTRELSAPFARVEPQEESASASHS